VGIVELLDERESLCFVLSGQYSCQLRNKGRVVRGLLNCSAQQGFCLGILLAHDQNVGQASIGGSRFGILGQGAPVGCFRGVELAGLLGDAGGEQRIVLSLRGELESR
jgi:hypothetical protein